MGATNRQTIDNTKNNGSIARYSTRCVRIVHYPNFAASISSACACSRLAMSLKASASW